MKEKLRYKKPMRDTNLIVSVYAALSQVSQHLIVSRRFYGD